MISKGTIICVALVILILIFALEFWSIYKTESHPVQPHGLGKPSYYSCLYVWHIGRKELGVKLINNANWKCKFESKGLEWTKVDSQYN